MEPGDLVDDRMLKVSIYYVQMQILMNRTLDIILTPSKAGYAAEILSIFVLGFSKVSTCLFYEGLFSQTQLRLSRSILFAVIIWMIMSVILLAVRCTHDPWTDISAARCGSLVRLCDF